MSHRRRLVVLLSVVLPLSPLLLAGPASAASPSSVAIGDVAVYEGDNGFTTARVTVTLSDPQAADLFVDYATVDGSATGGTAKSGADYVTRLGRVKIKAGKTNALIGLRVGGETAFEGDEAFGVWLTGISSAGVAISDGIATVTIRNDDPAATSPPSSVAIGDVAVYEGDSGFTTARVTVTLSDSQAADLFVDYATVDGSVTGGTAKSGADYVTRLGRVKIKAGKTNALVGLRVGGETAFEGDEAFGVWLTGISSAGVAISDGIATVTIRNDDASPRPDVPTALVATAGPSPRYLTATWSAPTTGAAVDGYDLEVTHDGDTDVIPDVASPNPFGCGPASVTASCTVRVRAFNGSGPGAWSDPVSASTWAPPEAPPNLRMLGSSSVEWDAPVSDRPIANYQVEKSVDGGLNWTPVVTTTSLDAATTCSACLVRVAAESEVGVGSYSTIDYASPLPGVPTLLAAEPGPLPRYLTATWSAPIDGAAVDGYDLEVERAGTTNVLSDVASPNVFICGNASVTDTCTLRVRAFNAAGSGEWSAAVSASTWAPPEAPPNLVASGTTVFWDVPSSDRPILGYWVFKSLNGGASWTHVTTTTNLHAAATCSVCLVRVQAQSEVGFGAFSTIEIAFSPPSAPTGLIVVRDSVNPALLHISWSAPLFAAPPVDSYTVTLNDFIFPITLHGITTTSVDYRLPTAGMVVVNVSAVNAAGMSSPVSLLVPAA